MLTSLWKLKAPRDAPVWARYDAYGDEMDTHNRLIRLLKQKRQDFARENLFALCGLHVGARIRIGVKQYEVVDAEIDMETIYVIIGRIRKNGEVSKQRQILGDSFEILSNEPKETPSADQP